MADCGRLRGDGQRRSRVKFRDWEKADRFLVCGELLAFAAAFVAIILDFPGKDWAKWGLYLAGGIGAGVLFGYAWYRSARDEVPLTGVSVRRIARVAELASFGQASNMSLNWDQVSDDGSRVPIDLEQSSMELKRLMLFRNIFMVGRLDGSTPDAQQIMQQVQDMSEEEVNNLTASMAVPPPFFSLDLD